jgi:hypothetical protein
LFFSQILLSAPRIQLSPRGFARFIDLSNSGTSDEGKLETFGHTLIAAVFPDPKLFILIKGRINSVVESFFFACEADERKKNVKERRNNFITIIYVEKFPNFAK